MHKVNVEQGSKEWHDQRFGCVTGTRLKNAVGAKWDARKECWKLGDEKIQDTLRFELLSERMSQNFIDDVSTKDMERGKELEPIAIKEASKHRGIEFVNCGMLVSDWCNTLKYSPDSIYEQNGIIIGGAEIKCPSGKKHIEYIIKDEIPKDYFWQVIGPMILDDSVEWWDFCSFDDRNYELPIFMKRMNKADHIELIIEAREHLKEFVNLVSESHLDMTF